MARARSSGAKGRRGAPAPRRTRTREAYEGPVTRDEIAASGETELSSAEAAEREVREDLQFLAREFLTWLVFHAEVEGGEFDGASTSGEVSPFTIAFGGRLALRTPAGMVTDVVMKGPSPAGSPDLRYALAGGLAVKEADLSLSQDDRVYTFGLAAEHLDLKRVKLPALLTNPEDAGDSDDDKATERLTLLDDLDAAVRVAFSRFLALRMKPAWHKTVVPAIRAWLDEGT